MAVLATFTHKSVGALVPCIPELKKYFNSAKLKLV
jgi:hypothetical protein